jgi:HSP20 family protein
VEDFFERFRRRRFPFLFDIERMFEEFDRMYEEMLKDLQSSAPRELVRERRLPDGRVVREFGPLVYGYSITVGPDGKPVIREFGNLRPGEGRERKLVVEREREPLVDVIEEEDKVKVVAEVPGVEREDIKLDATDTELTISVENPQRRYYKKVDLPARVEPDKAKASYRNGVLEVILPKVEPSKPKGRAIKIE